MELRKSNRSKKNESLEENERNEATASTEDNDEAKLAVEKGISIKKPTFPLRVSPIQTRSRTSSLTNLKTGKLGKNSKSSVKKSSLSVKMCKISSKTAPKTKIKSAVNISRYPLRSREKKESGKVKENSSSLKNKSTKKDIDKDLAPTSEDPEVDNESDRMVRKYSLKKGRKLKLSSNQNGNIKKPYKKTAEKNSTNHEKKKLPIRLAGKDNKEDTRSTRKTATPIENEISPVNGFVSASEEQKDLVTASEAETSRNIPKDLEQTGSKSSSAENGSLSVSEQNYPATAKETPLNMPDTFSSSENSNNENINENINENKRERDECTTQTNNLKNTTEKDKTSSFSVKPEEIDEEQNLQDIKYEIDEIMENFISITYSESEESESEEFENEIFLEFIKYFESIIGDECIKTSNTTSEGNSIVKRGNRRCYSKESFHYEYMRLKTFKNRIYSVGDCRLFSECGLICIFYLGSDTRFDIMYCIFCDIYFPNWAERSPIDAHKFVNPNCSFFSNLSHNVPLCSGKEELIDNNNSLDNLNKFLEDYLIFRSTYTSVESTLSSEFLDEVNILGENSIKINPQSLEGENYCTFLKIIHKKLSKRLPYFYGGLNLRMAEGGFFKTGFSDLVVCFKCNGGLLNWENTDDPKKEHAKYFPTCKFVTSSYSQSEINKMSEELENLKSGIPEREVALTPEETDLLAEHPVCKMLTDREGVDINFLKKVLKNHLEKYAIFPKSLFFMMHFVVDFVKNV